MLGGGGGRGERGDRFTYDPGQTIGVGKVSTKKVEGLAGKKRSPTIVNHLLRSR